MAFKPCSVLGGTRNQNLRRGLFQRCEPRAAPFLIVHGQLDAHVPVSQALELHAALSAVGVPATLYLIPDGDHFINESHRHVMQTSLLEFFTALEQEWISPQEATI